MPFVATIRAVLWTTAFCESTNGAMPCGKRLTVGTLHIYFVNRQLYVQQNGAYRPLRRVRCVFPQIPRSDNIRYSEYMCMRECSHPGMAPFPDPDPFSSICMPDLLPHAADVEAVCAIVAAGRVGVVDDGQAYGHEGEIVRVAPGRRSRPVVSAFAGTFETKFRTLDIT